MSNSSTPDDLHEIENENVTLTKGEYIPNSGTGLLFSEEMAQQISEFVGSPIFKKLKRVYILQKNSTIGRIALNSATNTEWLHYYKGMAAAVQLFFKDMETVAKEYKKANEATDDDSKSKK